MTVPIFGLLSFFLSGIGQWKLALSPWIHRSLSREKHEQDRFSFLHSDRSVADLCKAPQGTKQFKNTGENHNKISGIQTCKCVNHGSSYLGIKEGQGKRKLLASFRFSRTGCNLMPPCGGYPFQLKYRCGQLWVLWLPGIPRKGSKDVKNFLIDVGTVWEDQSGGS